MIAYLVKCDIFAEISPRFISLPGHSPATADKTIAVYIYNGLSASRRQRWLVRFNCDGTGAGIQ